MPFEIKDGRILITDENGDVALDTDERQFVWTDYNEGSVIVPGHDTFSQFGSITNPVSRDLDTVLHSINPFANTVFGAMRVSYDSIAADFDSLASEGWFQATGSFFGLFVPTNGTGNVDGNNIATTPWIGNCAIAVYTFLAQGGQLIFNEQTQCRPFSLALASTRVHTVLPDVLVEYKLYCGCFV